MMPPTLSYPSYPSYPRVRARARAQVPPKPLLTIILYGLYGVTEEVARECALAATELGVARAEVKHLQAACLALKAHPRAMMVASMAVRPWDREVIEDHAARAGTPLRWVASGADAYDTAKAVSSWSAIQLRLLKTLL